MLSPMNYGDIGTYSINNIIQSKLNDNTEPKIMLYN